MTYGENPRKRGILVQRFTGDNTPFQFSPPRPVSLVREWPEIPPFREADFSRSDPSSDGNFYAVPRLVYHIDEAAVSALTQYYRQNVPQKSSILDICSSWVSHYPLEFPKEMKEIVGTGMNALELAANDQLSERAPLDLNAFEGDEVKLPFEDDRFDVVTCVVSIDYMIHPI